MTVSVCLCRALLCRDSALQRQTETVRETSVSTEQRQTETVTETSFSVNLWLCKVGNKKIKINLKQA